MSRSACYGCSLLVRRSGLSPVKFLVPGPHSGLTNSEIAVHLVLSESTIKTHVSRVLAKTGPRDRVHAVIIAYDAGLVRPGGSPEAP
jgi:Bacterial regulatory proteins, luxR family